MSLRHPPRAAAWARTCAGAALLGLGLGGCGFGTAALFHSGASGSAENAHPVVSDVLIEIDTKHSPITFTFKLTDAESNPVDVDVLYVPPGGAPPVPLLLSGTSNLDLLSTDPSGLVHVRQWSFDAQVPTDDAYATGYKLTVRTRDLVSSADSAVFSVGNDAPVVSDLIVPTGEAAGLVPIAFNLSDSSSDLVSVSVAYEDVEDPGVLHPATSAGNPLVDLSTIPSPGVQQFFFWDTAADLQQLERDVRLHFTPSDGNAAGASALTSIFHVDNNAAPILQLQEGAFLTDPDSVRGIRVPFTTIDEESDEIAVVFQWRREDDEDFFASHTLPSTPEGIEALLSDEGQRREYHVCSPYRRSFEGRPAWIDATHVRLPELSGELSFLVQVGLVGNTLEILRPPLSLVPVSGPWHPNMLVRPVAALPLDGGTRALVLDENASGNWRLVRLRLLDGVIESTVASGSGTPGAVCFEAGDASVLVASALGSAWLVERILLADGAKTHVADFTNGPVEQGVPRGIASLGTHAAVLTVATSLVRVDWSASPALAVALHTGFERPWGVVVDPRDAGRVLVAENNAPETSAPGRIVALELATHTLEPLVIQTNAADGLAFPRPRGIATQRDGARLLALCETDPLTGRVELRSVDLGRADTSPAVSLGQVPGASPAALSAGAEDDLLLSTSAPDRVVHVAGGVERRATIAGVDAGIATVTLASAFTPALEPGSRWRVTVSDEVPFRASSSAAGEVHYFLWDSSEVPGGGDALLNGTPMDSDIGTVVSSTGPKPLSPPFGAESLAGSSGTSPRASVLADLDGDGALDLVFASGSDSLMVFLQTAAGAFDAPPVTLAAAGTMAGPVCVQAADLDGDGLVDLVSANQGSDNLTVFWQTAPGTFDPDPTLLGDSSTTLGAAFVQAADFDGDGLLDLVCANQGSDTLTVFRQTDPRTFVPDSPPLGDASTTQGPCFVEAADLDGDGRLDLVSANRDGDSLTVFWQTAGGSFDAVPMSVVGCDGPVWARATDLNRDGRLDLVSANRDGDDLTVFWQSAPRTFDPVPTQLGESLTSLNSPACVQAADLDGDGDLDLVSANQDSNDLTVFWQTETSGTFDPIPTIVGGQGIAGPADVQVADIDGDGDLDLVLANQGGDDLKLLWQTAPGTFDAEPIVVEGLPVDVDGPLAVQAADLDGDGDLDLVTANEITGNLTVFWQTGPAVFDPTPSIVVVPLGTAPPTAVQAADFDGDGDLDLVTANQDSNTLTLFTQDATHAFVSSLLEVPGTDPHPRFVLAVDLDRDSDLDLVCANQGNDTLTVFLQSSREPPSFDPSPLGDSSTTHGPVFVQAADLNGDGKLDLVSANYAGNNLTVFWQIDECSFDATPTSVGGCTGPVCVQAADLNGDGRLDLVSANEDGDNLTVFWQTAPGTFSPPSTELGDSLTTPGPSFVQAADLDQDGDLDLVSANRSGDTLTVFWQTAPGIFDTHPTTLPLSAGFDPRCIQAIDIDAEGDLDLVTASYAHHALWVFRRLH